MTILEQIAALRSALAAQYASAETVLQQLDQLETAIRAEDATVTISDGATQPVPGPVRRLEDFTVNP